MDGQGDLGDAFLDSDMQEWRGGIIIFSKQAELYYGDKKITLLDHFCIEPYDASFYEQVALCDEDMLNRYFEMKMAILIQFEGLDTQEIGRNKVCKLSITELTHLYYTLKMFVLILFYFKVYVLDFPISGPDGKRMLAFFGYDCVFLNCFSV